MILFGIIIAAIMALIFTTTYRNFNGIEYRPKPSYIELIGDDNQYLWINYNVREIFKINLNTVNVKTRRGDRVRIWYYDVPSNQNSHTGFYSWYDRPDAYLWEAGFKLLVDIKDEGEYHHNVSDVYKTILVEATFS